MFGNRAQARHDKDAERERGHFEQELRSALNYARIILAISRMTLGEKFTFAPEIGGAPPSDVLRRQSSSLHPGRRFFGVLHEQSARQDWENLHKWVHVELGFEKVRPRSPKLGRAYFYASAAREESALPALNRQLHLDVAIGDEDGAIAMMIESALEARALSGDPFLHVEIGIEVTDAEACIANLGDHGGGFDLAVTSLGAVTDLTLRNAPLWSWKWADL